MDLAVKRGPDSFTVEITDPRLPAVKQAVAAHLGAPHFELEDFDLLHGGSPLCDDAAAGLCSGDTLEVVPSRSALARESLCEAGIPLSAASLLQAAERGDVDAARNLLAAGLCADPQDQPQRTALMLASKRGHTTLCDLLLRHGARPNAAEASGWTSLMIAAHNGHTDVIQLLLRHGADPNARASKKATTCLMLASRRCGAAACEALVDSGADLNACDTRSTTCLMHACASSNTDAAMLLLERGADVHAVDSAGRSALVLAAHSGASELCGALASGGAQNSCGWRLTALLAAAHGGQGEACQTLLCHFPHAARQDVEPGTGSDAAMLALRQCHAGTACLLLRLGTDPNHTRPDGVTVLMVAAYHGAAQAVQLLLHRGADACRQDVHSHTPLMYAVASHRSVRSTQQAAVMRMLLQHGSGGGGADHLCHLPHGLGAGGALCEAAGRGLAPACRMLLEHGTPPGSSDADGVPALHRAAAAGHASLCGLLLGWGADAGQRCPSQGSTPLHAAASAGRAEVCAVLLAGGAPLDATDGSGLSSLQRARLVGAPAVAVLLEEHACKASGGVPSCGEP